MAISVALDPNNTAAQNKTEIVNALASYTRGGEIRLPRAEADFLCEPGIVWPATRNLSLVGEGGGNGYDDSNAGTKLRFTSGTTGLDCSQIDMFSDPAAPYAFIGGISFNGDHVCQVPLKVGGIMDVRRVEVKNGSVANILATKLINSLTFEDVLALGGDGYGFFMPGYAGVSNPNNTVVNFIRFRARSNLVGMRFEQAQGVRFTGGRSILESNYHEAIEFYRPAGRVLSDIIAHDLWVEGNWRGLLGHAITIDGDEGFAPENIRLIDCSINVGGLSKAMSVNRLNGGLLDNPHGAGQIDLGANCHDFGLLDVPSGFTLADLGTANWRKARSGIGEAPPVGGGTGTWAVTSEHILPDANQTMTAGQLVSANCEMFPTVNRTITLPSAASIISAMGGYQAGATTEFVIMNRTGVLGVKAIFIGGAGTTIKGNNQIGNGSGTFAVRQDSPTAVSVINKSQN